MDVKESKQYWESYYPVRQKVLSDVKGIQAMKEEFLLDKHW